MAKKKKEIVAECMIQSKKGCLVKKKIEAAEVRKYFKQWIKEGAEPERFKFVPCASMSLIEAARETRKALIQVLIDEEVSLCNAYRGIKAANELKVLVEHYIKYGSFRIQPENPD